MTLLGAIFALALLPTPLAAESLVVTDSIETIDVIDYAILAPSTFESPTESAPAPQQVRAATKDHFGPFAVIAPDRVRMTGTVDSFTPQRFRAMLRAHPGIRHIDMVDCDGSVDEEANLALARMIRRAGIATHVPAGGSVRSGAVELWLAGAQRSAHPSAEFLVHSWMDEDGYQANDYPANDPVHREYLDYYAEMGVPAERARAFYQLTNSVPFESHLRLTPSDLKQFSLLQ